MFPEILLIREVVPLLPHQCLLLGIAHRLWSVLCPPLHPPHLQLSHPPDYQQDLLLLLLLRSLQCTPWPPIRWLLCH